MALEDKQYKLEPIGDGVVDELGNAIPNSAKNLDWREYQGWLMLPGKVVTPADQKPLFEPRELDILKRAFLNKGIMNQAELIAAKDQLIAEKGNNK